MSRPMRRSPRGQAVVEFALGAMVFVTILVWAIHMAEMAYLAPKVHEAAASALWDTTAEQMHKLPTDFNPRDKAINDAGGKASSLYSGFDGRTGSTGSSISLVFTGASMMNVQCEQDNNLADMRQKRLRAYPNNANGGMGCFASARFQVINFPREYMDQGPEGFFKEKNYPPGLNTLTFCSFGRAQGGNCDQGKISLLLDDWGLTAAPTSPKEKEDCELQNCPSAGNKPFYDLVHQAYAQTGAEGGGAGRAMAMAVIEMAAGGAEGKYWISYLKGPDSGMSGGDSDPADWTTNVVNKSRNNAYKARSQPARFLGIANAIK